MELSERPSGCTRLLGRHVSLSVPGSGRTLGRGVGESPSERGGVPPFREVRREDTNLDTEMCEYSGTHSQVRVVSSDRPGWGRRTIPVLDPSWGTRYLGDVRRS